MCVYASEKQTQTDTELINHFTWPRYAYIHYIYVHIYIIYIVYIRRSHKFFSFIVRTMYQACEYVHVKKISGASNYYL